MRSLAINPTFPLHECSGISFPRPVPQVDGTLKMVDCPANAELPDPSTTDLKACVDAGVNLEDVGSMLYSQQTKQILSAIEDADEEA